ncbi:MAG TPA: MFS transporter [Desulfomonilaceae bacterium]|nr:MFS transporter [Desulfomonilaceae bacterium]
MPRSEHLMTREFLALNAIIFLAFCNISVFFQFHEYLGTLPISSDYFGTLIGLFSLSVLVIRPIISPFLHPGNAKRWIAISSAAVIVSLFLYNLALDFWSMAVVRSIHGAAYVLLATAVLSKLVDAIPANKSGQAFGLISVITLLPYAVIPPLLEPLGRWVGSFDQILNLSALMMVLAFPLLSLVHAKPAEHLAHSTDRIGLQDLKGNLKDRGILLLLFLSLLVWTSFTPVFYFLKGYGEKIGITNPGWFFTISTLMEILVRLVAGHMFDRLDKSRLLLASMMWLAGGNFVLAAFPGPETFYAMSVFLGLGWGVAMPVLSGLVFDMSEARFRALNSNLAMEMFQAGFFVGPVAGGAVLVYWGYPELYYACGGLLLVGVIATCLLGLKQENPVTTSQLT